MNASKWHDLLACGIVPTLGPAPRLRGTAVNGTSPERSVRVAITKLDKLLEEQEDRESLACLRRGEAATGFVSLTTSHQAGHHRFAHLCSGELNRSRRKLSGRLAKGRAPLGRWIGPARRLRKNARFD